MWQSAIITLIVLLALGFVCRTFWRSWQNARQGRPECPGCCQGCSKLDTLEPQAPGNERQPDCTSCELNAPKGKGRDSP